MANVTNSTLEEAPLVAQWTLSPIVALLTFIFGCLTNGGLLGLFVKDPDLHTPFNVYLINLMITNLACLFIQYPLEFLANLFGFWFMTDSACTAYIYGVYILQAAIKNAHQLIAINRIWAVIHPLSYRTYHSKRIAVLFCVGMWVYVHLALLQGVIADVLYYRLPPRSVGCFVNAAAQPIWNKVTVLLVYDLPLIVMILAFPIVLCAKVARRKTAKRNIVGPTSYTQNIQVSHVNQVIRMGNRLEIVKEGSAARVDPDQESAAPVRRVKHNSNGYMVLAFLTISACICWAPINVCYIMLIYVNRTPSPTFFQVANVLFSCQCVLDPILFTLAISSVKNSLRRAFLSCCR